MNEITNNESLDDTIDALMTKPTITENTTEDITTNTTSELENTQQESAINQHTHCIYINENTCDPIIQRTVTNTQVTTNLKGKEDYNAQLDRARDKINQRLKSIGVHQPEQRNPNDMTFTSYYEEPKPITIEKVTTVEVQADKNHLISFSIVIMIVLVVSLLFIKDTYFLQPFVLANISALTILVAYGMLDILGAFFSAVCVSLYWFIMFMTNRMDFLNTFDDYDYIQKS